MEKQILEENNIIKFLLPRSTIIKYITQMTGEPGTLKIINPHLNLVRGRIYKIPVNTEKSLDENFIIKLFGDISEKLEVRNISNGVATVIPIIHNTCISDQMEIGKFI